MHLKSKCIDLDTLCTHLKSKCILKPTFVLHDVYINTQSRVEETKVDESREDKTRPEETKPNVPVWEDFQTLIF